MHYYAPFHNHEHYPLKNTLNRSGRYFLLCQANGANASFNTFVSSCQAMCKKPETKNALRLVPRERSIAGSLGLLDSDGF